MSKRKSYYRKLSELTPEEMAIFERNILEDKKDAEKRRKEEGIDYDKVEPRKFSKWL